MKNSNQKFISSLHVSSAILLAACCLAVPGCSGDDMPVIAGQDELTQFIEQHPEMLEPDALDAERKNEQSVSSPGEI